jgi:oxygen-independent coproporphyrinogen III oxidase
MAQISDLLEKYSKPGPRYTSYPTAPYFTESFGPADWREEIAASQNTGRDLSLYVHIPFCDTLCYYCGCNMVATGNYAKAETYVDFLVREIDQVAGLSARERVVRQMHWGGGTPTYLKPRDLLRLATHIRSRFRFAGDTEVGCEMDPRELSREHILALKEAGFNRLSIGVQDFDDAVQRAVNRIQPEGIIRQAFSWMREAGFASINMDLMVGLPHQTLDSYSRTLDKAIDLAPDRLAVFSYAHVPWMKRHQKLIREADLPDFQTRIRLQQLIFQRLTEAGYVYIGMDHYARPGDELVKAQRDKTLWRNFQGYTTHKNCDIYAFGASSISQTEDVYAQNLKRLAAYQTRVAEAVLPTERGVRLSKDDKIRRDAITTVMCDLELDRSVFSEKWGIAFDDYFGDALAELAGLEADGLVKVTADKIKVTETGRTFLRNIAMAFDGYLKVQAEEKPRYSRTV